MEEKVDKAVTLIIDWAASGQARFTGVRFFRLQIETELEELSLTKEQRIEVWNKMQDVFKSSEGWTDDDIRLLAVMLQ